MLPSADQLLDKYLSVIGGADALQKIHEPRGEGNAHAIRRPAFPVDVYSKAPDKRVSVMHLQGGDSFTGFLMETGMAPVFRALAYECRRRKTPPHASMRIFIPGAREDALSEVQRRRWRKKSDGDDTYLVTGVSEGQPTAPFGTWTKESACCCALCGTQKLLSAATQRDRLCDYRRRGWREVPFPLDACTPRQPIHHPGRADSSKMFRGRLQNSHRTAATAARNLRLPNSGRCQTIFSWHRYKFSLIFG